MRHTISPLNTKELTLTKPKEELRNHFFQEIHVGHVTLTIGKIVPEFYRIKIISTLYI